MSARLDNMIKNIENSRNVEYLVCNWRGLVILIIDECKKNMLEFLISFLEIYMQRSELHRLRSQE